MATRCSYVRRARQGGRHWRCTLLAITLRGHRLALLLLNASRATSPPGHQSTHLSAARHCSTLESRCASTIHVSGPGTTTIAQEKTGRLKNANRIETGVANRRQPASLDRLGCSLSFSSAVRLVRFTAASSHSLRAASPGLAGTELPSCELRSWRFARLDAAHSKHTPCCLGFPSSSSCRAEPCRTLPGVRSTPREPDEHEKLSKAQRCQCSAHSATRYESACVEVRGRGLRAGCGLSKTVDSRALRLRRCLVVEMLRANSASRDSLELQHAVASLFLFATLERSQKWYHVRTRKN